MSRIRFCVGESVFSFFLFLFFFFFFSLFSDNFNGFYSAASSEWLLGAFEKLREATMSFAISVCLSAGSVRLPVRMKLFGSH